MSVNRYFLIITHITFQDIFLVLWGMLKIYIFCTFSIVHIKHIFHAEVIVVIHVNSPQIVVVMRNKMLCGIILLSL